MKDLNLKEKRKEAIAALTAGARLAVFLGVYKIWFEKRGTSDGYWRFVKINPYNVFTWILILFMIPFYMAKSFFEIFKDFKNIFKEEKRYR